MKKNYSLAHLILAILFSVLSSFIVICTVFNVFFDVKIKTNFQSADLKLNEIMNLVEKYYVGELDEQTLADNVALGCVSGLNDKYASYFSSEEANARLDSFFGLATGIGIQVINHPETHSMYVLGVHKNSPATDAGILPKDQIIQVDDIKIIDAESYVEALTYIKKQPINSEITVQIERFGKMTELKITLRQFDSQSVFYKLIDGIGYVQLTEFNELGVDQFKSAVNDLVGNGANSLIFDLRGNGGGTLDSVCEMLDFLLPEGDIVTVKYKDEKDNQIYKSDKAEISLPMAVLTDENTASASELFALCLKDYNKAITVGTTTFGKGVVQRTFSLSDGSLVSFTVAKYYTKSGACPDKVGVAPNIETEWTDDELKYRHINDITKDKDFLAAKAYLAQLS